MDRALMSIESDGYVVWIPQVQYESSCYVNMTDFPFDVQTCSFKFGSWGHSPYKIKLKFSGDRKIDLEHYLENSEWNISGNVARKEERSYSCCNAT